MVLAGVLLGGENRTGRRRAHSLADMAIKLHTCANNWVHGPHPCWQVRKALGEAGISYEQVKHPFRRGRRDELHRLTGQRVLPVVEFEDGTILREESKDLVRRIQDGRLDEARGAQAPG
jgi:glutathione S-transferase-like protein